MFKRESDMFKIIFSLFLNFLVYFCLWKTADCIDIVTPECPNCNNSNKFYEGCQQNKALIDPTWESLEFDQSVYEISFGIKFSAQRLPFSKYFAWCINKQSSKENLFKEWATVTFLKSYIVYALRVNGFRNEDGTFDNQLLPKTFKLEYSRDGATWFDVAGGTEFESVKASKEDVIFSPPLLLTSVRIRMRIDSTESINTCIKLELYGCEAIPIIMTTTAEPSTTPISTAEPTPQPMSIASYSIKQGDPYNSSLSFLDTEYNRPAVAKGILRNGVGCLMDEKTVESPLLNPFCWIGWNRNLTEKPYLQINFPSKVNISGFQLTGFNGIDIGTIQNMTIKVTDSKDNYTLVGYACPEVNEMKDIINYKVNLKQIQAESIEILFTFSKQWILLRKLVLYQDDISHLSKIMKVSPTLACDKGDTKPSKQDSSSQMIPVVLGVVVGLSVVVLIVIAIIYFKCISKGKLKIKGNQQQDSRQESVLL